MDIEIPPSVLIVGAGPTGLLLACELGVRGIPVVVVDEKQALSRHPKANTQSARTMEIYRRHGISTPLRQQGLRRDRATDVAYFTRLFGHELHRVPLPSPIDAENTARAGDARWPTPEPQTRVTQMTVESLLLARARSFRSVDIRFGCKAVDLVQRDAVVELTVEESDSAVQRRFIAPFLVGCDGGRSYVRKSLGIRFLGKSGLEMQFLGGRMLATYFRAPTLLARFPHADTWMHWIMHPAARAILLLIDLERSEFLVHFQLKTADEDETTIDFAERLAAIVGEPVEHEVISSAVWRAGVGLVAERFSAGRCFLVGDAIHLFTPTGGFGLNTGIEDAFNLGWKLAAVCGGVAPLDILDTYEAERRPIALRNTHYALELAQKNGACPVSEALDWAGPAGDSARDATTEHLSQFARWEFDTPGVQLGARYDGSPLTAPHASAPPVDSPTLYVPSSIPGGRLPHVWLNDGKSVFDSLGAEFTLILLGGDAKGANWAEAAKALRLDLTILDLAHDDAALRVLGAETLLVRPDQHIAWRGVAPRSAESVLAAAVARTFN